MNCPDAARLGFPANPIPCRNAKFLQLGRVPRPQQIPHYQRDIVRIAAAVPNIDQQYEPRLATGVANGAIQTGEKECPGRMAAVRSAGSRRWTRRSNARLPAREEKRATAAGAKLRRAANRLIVTPGVAQRARRSSCFAQRLRAHIVDRTQCIGRTSTGGTKAEL
jgi:hypothetical protein